MAFARRILNFRFQLGQGSFGEGGFDTVDLTGLRATANISRAGGNQYAESDLQIWGMPLDVMNRLTVLNMLTYQELRNNIVTVSAGDEINGTAVCFQGNIIEAWANGESAPDVAFQVSAVSAKFDSLKPVKPTSYNGSVDVATVIGGIAAQFNLSLENNGVSAQIESPYLPGTLKMQLESIAAAANISYYIDQAENVLAIWPKGGARGGQTIEVSPDSGLVGYPTFTQQGCRFRLLYSPSLSFGRRINVTSDFGPANGGWTIASVNHNLDANVPGGMWFTEVECTLADRTAPIISR